MRSAPPIISDDVIDLWVIEALRLAWGRQADVGTPGTWMPAQLGKLPEAHVRAILATAEREALDALVAIGMEQLGVPADLLDLETRKTYAQRRSLIVQASQQAVTQAFHDAGVLHVFLKGCVTDLLFWKGTGLRGTTDIDVLVPHDAAERAHEALRRLGYAHISDERHPATEAAKPERLYGAIENRTRFDVDLHFGILKAPPYREGAAELLERCRVYETPFGKVRGLAIDDMLAHVVGNLAGSKFLSGRWKLLLDAATLFTHPNVRLPRVLETVERWGCAWAFWGVLQVLRHRYGLPVSVDLLQEFRLSRAVRRVTSDVAGVCRAPRIPRTGLGRTFRVERVVIGRPLWPLEASMRWARLRALDYLHSRPPLR